MELFNAYKATKVIKATENYSLADSNKILQEESMHKAETEHFFDDRMFWDEAILNRDNLWNKKLCFRGFTLCDWIARVPGLYWAKYSEAVRRHSNNEIKKQSKEWIQLHPSGKSKKVVGGVGTILLPPNDEGKRLMSISSNYNASVGVPILIFPDVFDALKLTEGDLINVKNARWQPIDVSWSKRFASTGEIPRGYVVIDKPEKIEIISKNVPFTFHPFSIMEYQKGDAILYDFVFLGVDNKLKNLRAEIETFFKNYASEEDRHGRYLLNPNMIQPIFETQYSSPSDMQSPSEKAKLELIYKRIRNEEFTRVTIEKLILILPKHYDTSAAIKRLARNVGVSVSILQEDNAASMSAQLINYCFDRSRIEVLVDRMCVDYPQILKI